MVVENRSYLAFTDGIGHRLKSLERKKIQLFQLKHYYDKEEALKLRAQGKGRNRMENNR